MKLTEYDIQLLLVAQFYKLAGIMPTRIKQFERLVSEGYAPASANFASDRELKG